MMSHHEERHLAPGPEGGGRGGGLRWLMDLRAPAEQDGGAIDAT